MSPDSGSVGVEPTKTPHNLPSLTQYTSHPAHLGVDPQAFTARQLILSWACLCAGLICGLGRRLRFYPIIL